MIEISRTNYLHNNGDFTNVAWEHTTNEDSFIFSYWTNVDCRQVIRRPWWKFWAYDTIKNETISTKKVHVLSADEGRFLINALNERGVEARVLQKILGDISFVQIENGNSPSSYISTTSQNNPSPSDI